MAIYSEFSHKTWWFSIAMLVYQRVLNSTKHSVSLDLNLFPSELRQSFPNWGRNLARNQCCKGHRIFQRTLALDHKVHPPDKIWQVQTGKRKRSKWVRFNILTFLWRFSCSLLWIFILMRPTISEGPPNIWAVLRIGTSVGQLGQKAHELCWRWSCCWAEISSEVLAFLVVANGWAHGAIWIKRPRKLWRVRVGSMLSPLHWALVAWFWRQWDLDFVSSLYLDRPFLTSQSGLT